MDTAKAPATPVARDRTVSPARAGERAAARGLAAVYLLLGYEWLLSALDKLLSAAYRGGLAGDLREAAADNPNRWYARFLAADVIPHARAFAAVIAWSELLVALGLALGAAAWVGGARIPDRWLRRFRLAACGALLGGAVMTANYYLLAGHRFPWLDTGAPFDEGLSIDGLLTLLALALLAVELAALRPPRGHGRSADVPDRQP